MTKLAPYLGMVVIAAAGCTVEAIETADDHGSLAASARADAMCGVSCERAADCTDAEPYCNLSIGECQAAPPMCESDADCEVEGDRCWSDGYCWFYPELNCAPGEVVFEGQCDNPACVQERCPEGTVLDEDTCACNPTSAAPSCASQDDCDAAYPYCNLDTGVCQTTPPECVGDGDCDASAPHCASTGYCSAEPELNCAPGEIVVEGRCESAGCDAKSCPAGAFLDEESCTCVPTCEASS